MSDFDRTGVQLDEPVKRPGASRLADRLVRTLGGFDRTRQELPDWEDGATVEYSTVGGLDEPLPGQAADRFPVSRHGYDRGTVDRHIDRLEREIAELRDQGPEAISAEIDRIGEQTASILKVAHDEAHQTRRVAQAEADRCLADAAANALAITDDANKRLRQLDSETDVVWHERARLIDDVRGVATALMSLADDAAERFPSESEKVHAPVRAPSKSDGDLVADQGDAQDQG